MSFNLGDESVLYWVSEQVDGHADGIRGVNWLWNKSGIPLVIVPSKAIWNTHPAKSHAPRNTQVISGHRSTWSLNWSGGPVLSFWIPGKDLIKIEKGWSKLNRATHFFVLRWPEPDIAMPNWLNAHEAIRVGWAK